MNIYKYSASVLAPCLRRATVLAGLLPLLAQAAPMYGVTEIGPMNIQVRGGINNAGQVVGTASDAGGDSRAAIYANGVTSLLGTLGGRYSEGLAINASGHVAGRSYLADNYQFHAFLYRDGAMTDLGTLGGENSYARGINASSHVAGYSDTGNGDQRAFVYRDGVMTAIGTLGGTRSYAHAINDAGQVVGHAFIADDASAHAFLYQDGVMTDLGTLGGTFSQAYGINAKGQVIGYSATEMNEGFHAYLYENGVMTNLGTLGGFQSVAQGINSAGQVVGYSEVDDTAAGTAFLYQDGVMIDLNTLIKPSSGWRLLNAYGINDQQQITAYGCNSRTGACGSLLLDLGEDSGDDPAGVPEPGSAAMLAGGMLALAWSRRRAARR